MLQSRDGYLWLGTLGGLARFDGLNSTIFDEGNTPELDSSRVIRIFEDSRTNFWVATELGGLLRVDLQGRTVRTSPSPGASESSSRVLAFAEDHAGELWLYRADGQLACYDGQMRAWTVDQPARQSRLIAAEASGLLWLNTQRGLLAVGPLPVRGASLPVAYRSATTVDFLLGSKGPGYWRFAGGEILYCVTNEIIRRLGPYPWRAGVLISAACEDADGHLVVGTYGDPGDGVYWFDHDGKAVRIEGLSHNSILSLLVDGEGTLWVGTDGGGLNRIRRQVFWVVDASLGTTVQSVCPDATNGVWIGYNGTRVDHWTPEGATHYEVTRPNVNLGVRSVYVDRQGRVWAGTHGGGLFLLRDGRFQPEKGFDDVANPWVSVVFQDREGTLWAGTQGGLAYWDEKNWRTFGSLDGLSGTVVQAIAEAPDGALWVGTDGGGLNRILGRKLKSVYRKADGLAGDHVFAVLATGTNEVWVGTSSGLSWFKDGVWESFTGKEGLSGNSIRYLLDDHEGNLWLGSNAGLMRANQDSLANLARGATNRAGVRHFGKMDGLPTRECTQGSQPSAARTADGRMWFATIKGLASVANMDIVANTNPPPVTIQALILDGMDLVTNALNRAVPESIEMPAGSESLEIHFAGINLNAPEKTRFRYRLENHESAWNEISGNSGMARYTRLPADDYTFRLISANEAGPWSETGVTLAIVVLPPFWQTWWFVAMMSLAALGSVVAMVHYISTQKLQRQLASLRQQEALERERGRIARDLHDQLGANLTQVALLGELAEADKHQPEEVQSHARQISQTARDTTHALDEIVWTVNPANDTLEGLANYICKYAQDYLEIAGLKYRVEVPPRLPEACITPELRHNAFLVSKEALNNVVKHARASSVWIRIESSDDGFAVEIEDDGAGLPWDFERKGRNGVKNMRSRMADAGGRFTLEPRQGGGTIARLEAPLDVKRQHRLRIN